MRGCDSLAPFLIPNACFKTSPKDPDRETCAGDLFFCIVQTKLKMRNRAAILSDISASELRLKQLKQELEAAESSGKLTNSVAQSPTFVTDQVTSTHKTRWPLPAEDYKRYGRQMIMPEIGLHGILKSIGLPFSNEEHANDLQVS